MGLFSRRKINKEARNRPRYAPDYIAEIEAVPGSDGTSFACIDRIASEFAGLNYAVYDCKTHQKVKNHSILELLKQPNTEERHFNFFYQSAVDYYNGGCYWLKLNYSGETVSLFRLDPHKVKVARDVKTNKRVFNYNGAEYTDNEILYIPSRFCYSTLRGGQSIFGATNSVFSTAGKVEAYTQKSFDNGINGKRLVIDIEKALPDATEEQIAELKASFQNEYSGPNNAGRPIIKKNGIEYSELSGGTDNRAAELSENRKIQEHEVSKVFGVPEAILNNETNANLENVFVYFNEFAIRPLATMFQEVINSLLDESIYYFEFDYNGLMKVSLSQRIEAYNKQFAFGEMSINEIRAKENLPPIEAGDTHFVPVNMMPLNDETVEAYMAQQKQTVNSNHFAGGDDKK